MDITTGIDHARAARLFHALADPKRLRVLELLRGGEHCVCDLTDALDAGQSLLSFHLKTLRDAGLVTADGGCTTRSTTTRSPRERSAADEFLFLPHINNS